MMAGKLRQLLTPKHNSFAKIILIKKLQNKVWGL